MSFDLEELVEGPIREHYEALLLKREAVPAQNERPSEPTESTHTKKARDDSHVAYLTEAQRDRRTVFVQRLAPHCTSTDLERFFNGRDCSVRYAKIVLDRRTRRSKGVAYVEFYEEETVRKALKLTGERLLGMQVVVELTETEKNRLAEEAAKANAPGTGPSGTMPVASAVDELQTRLYIGGLHPSLTEVDLLRVFEPFGELTLPVQLLKDEASGSSKGVAFVEYGRAEAAKAAFEALNGFELAGRAIRVGIMRGSGQPAASASAKGSDSVLKANRPVLNESTRPSVTTATESTDMTESMDDEETLALDARKRTELMMKLFERK
jgi:RNA-binding protein 39